MIAAVESSSMPRLALGMKLVFDQTRSQYLLLGPESVLQLNPTAAAILQLCDGERTVADIVLELRARFDDADPESISDFMARLHKKRFLELHYG